jgi:hypothetical protein
VSLSAQTEASDPRVWRREMNGMIYPVQHILCEAQYVLHRIRL